MSFARRGVSVFFLVFSVVFCVWERVSVSLARRGWGGSSINWIEVSLGEAFCYSQCWEDVSGLLDWQG